MHVKAFIIHLVRSTARWPQVQRLQSQLPIPSEVIAAVDGKSLSTARYEQVVRRRLHTPSYPFPLSKGEAGCFLSHRLAWQRVLSEKLDAAIILEDDVDLHADTASDVITAAIAGVEPDEWIRFPHAQRGESGPAVRTSGLATTIEPWLPGRGMLMQAVGPIAAQRLLAASHHFDRPVDSYLQMQWLHGARVLSMRPFIVEHVDHRLGGSVLQNKHRGVMDRAYRELCRPILRLSVRAANDQWRRRAA